MQEAISQLLGIANRTVYKWQQDGRPIISFLYEYFDQKDIEEYLQYKSMQKLALLNQTEPITAFELERLSTLLNAIEEYVKTSKTNREGFLIKFYRVLRDFENENDFIKFARDYNMFSLEALRNVMWGSSMYDVIDFFQEYLSKKDQEILLNRRIYIMPTLKSMRKYNSHLKD